MDWLWASLIGVGGAVVGGIVGGIFVLRSGKQQWDRDREDARTDRSHQAAMSIAEAIGHLEQEIVAWQAARHDTIDLTATFNTTSRVLAVQSMALTDAALRDRVQTHIQLAGRLIAVAQQSVDSPFPPSMMDPVRRHADAVISALEAHVQGQPLPKYNAPPLTDVKALLDYQP